MAMSLAYPLDDPRTIAPAAALTEVMERQGVHMTFARDEEIYAQGDEVEFLFQLISGSVRTTRLTSDGRRQIGDFYYPGDLFGLETGPDHLFSAEALSDSNVLVLRRIVVRALTGDAELNRAILNATRLELERAQAHLLLLGHKSARERVAGFLFGIARRASTGEVALPMGRQDMADYLGLTIETVSRMLTQLQDTAVVEFAAARRFRVCNWRALEHLSE
jgi:CRP/FNR family transcriptional regulator, nitrogen fixation regulation protein